MSFRTLKAISIISIVNFVWACSLPSGPQAAWAQNAGNPSANGPALVTSGSSNGSDSIVQSPDGRFFAIASGNGVDVWDSDKGYRIRHYRGPKSTVSSIAFSGDGRKLAAAAGAIKSAEVFIWDFETGIISSTYQLSAPDQFSMSTYVAIKALAFSADSQKLICAGSFGTSYGKRVETEIVRILDLPSGRTLKTLKNPGGYDAGTMELSPDKSTMAIGLSDGTIKLFTSDGSYLRSAHADGDSISSIRFSPDGTRLATAAYSTKRENTKVEIWRVDPTTRITALSDNGAFTGVAWAPDGQTVATRNFGTLRTWDATKGTLLSDATSLSAGGQLVSYLQGGTTLLTVTAEGLTKVDVRSLKVVQHYGFPLATNIVLGLSADNPEAWIESASSCVLYAVNTMTGAITSRLNVEQIQGNCPLLVSSSDGTKLSGVLYGDPLDVKSKRDIAFFDLSTGTKGRLLATGLKDPDSVSISEDGSRIAVQDDKAILVIDTRSGSVIRKLEAPLRYPSIFALSPDGRRVASSDSIGIFPQGGSLYVWDVASGSSARFLQKEKFTNKKLPSDRIVFSPDGQSFVGTGSDSSHYSADYWSALGPKLSRQISLADNTTTMWATAFHPDGSKLLIGSWDGIIRLWDLKTGTLLQKFIGHEAPVNQVKFSAKNERIISSDNDTVRIWDTKTGELLISIYITADGDWLEVTPEGFFDASANGAHMLNVVRGLDAYSIDQFFDALHRPDLVREKLAGDPLGKVREAAAKLDLGRAIASGRPPDVALSKEDSSDSNSANATFEALITDQGGGIGKIEWRVNGVTVGIDEPEKSPATPDRAIRLKKTVPLEAGDNLVQVIAYNAPGIVSSRPSGITVKWDDNASKAPPGLYVLAVGINEYWDSRLRLTFASPDAKSFAQAMQEGSKGLYANSEIVLLTDEQASAAHLDEAFAKLSKKIHSQDVFVLFMAGHGKTVDGRFFFIPQEFRYRGEESVVTNGIGQDQLQRWLGRIAARKSILLFDACESGTLTADNTARRGMEEMTAIDRLTRAMGRSVLTATTDDKPALEGIQGHGVFTYALLQAFREAPPDADGFINVMELASYLDRRVPEISFDAFQIRQVPQAKIVGSNFPISHRLASLPPADASSAPISKVPTHVIIQSALAHGEPSAASQGAGELSPGTQVRVLTVSNGWVLVARDGVKLGFVEQEKLAAMH